MGKTQLILLAVVGAALAGCVSPKVTTSAPAAVNFHQFHTVKLVVTDSAKTAYAKEGLPMFDGLLKGRLESLGYTLVEAEPEMILSETGSQSGEATRMGLLSRSPSQIGDFIQNNGHQEKIINQGLESA